MAGPGASTVGLCGPLLVAVYYAHNSLPGRWERPGRWSCSPAGAHLGFGTVLIWSLVLGCLAAAAMAAMRDARGARARRGPLRSRSAARSAMRAQAPSAGPSRRYAAEEGNLMSRKRKSSRARKSPRESIRKASESMSAASSPTRKPRTRFGPPRSRCAGPHARSMTPTRLPSCLRDQGADGAGQLGLPPVVSRRALPLPSPTPALEGPAPVRAGKGRCPKNRARAPRPRQGARRQWRQGQAAGRRRVNRHTAPGPGRLMVRGASWALIVLGVLALVDAGDDAGLAGAGDGALRHDPAGRARRLAARSSRRRRPARLVAERLALVHAG